MNILAAVVGAFGLYLVLWAASVLWLAFACRGDARAMERALGGQTAQLAFLIPLVMAGIAAYGAYQNSQAQRRQAEGQNSRNRDIMLGRASAYGRRQRLAQGVADAYGIGGLFDEDMRSPRGLKEAATSYGYSATAPDMAEPTSGDMYGSMIASGVSAGVGAYAGAQSPSVTHPQTPSSGSPYTGASGTSPWSDTFNDAYGDFQNQELQSPTLGTGRMLG